jgi:hypothetical protein
MEHSIFIEASDHKIQAIKEILISKKIKFTTPWSSNNLEFTNKNSCIRASRIVFKYISEIASLQIEIN